MKLFLIFIKHIYDQFLNANLVLGTDARRNDAIRYIYIKEKLLYLRLLTIVYLITSIDFQSFTP